MAKARSNGSKKWRRRGGSVSPGRDALQSYREMSAATVSHRFRLVFGEGVSEGHPDDPEDYRRRLLSFASKQLELSAVIGVGGLDDGHGTWSKDLGDEASEFVERYELTPRMVLDVGDAVLSALPGGEEGLVKELRASARAAPSKGSLYYQRESRDWARLILANLSPAIVEMPEDALSALLARAKMSKGQLAQVLVAAVESPTEKSVTGKRLR